jgi:hypothetical protein
LHVDGLRDVGSGIWGSVDDCDWGMVRSGTAVKTHRRRPCSSSVDDKFAKSMFMSGGMYNRELRPLRRSLSFFLKSKFN